MGKHRNLRVPASSPYALRSGREYSTPYTSDDARRTPSGWWILPLVVLGSGVWVIIFRAVWAWFS